MPNVDYGSWGSKVGNAAPGGMVGPSLASSASITPTHPVHHVSGTESITTIVVPWTGFQGDLILIAAGAWTMTTGGNIGTALTAVASQALKLTYDGSVWYPHITD